MKKIFTLIFASLTIGLLSQNFSAYKVNNAQTTSSATLTNGYILSEITTATTNTLSPTKTEFKVKIVNNTASTMTLNVLRRVIYNNPVLMLDGNGNFPDSYFCYGTICHPSNVNLPGPTDYCVLGVSGSTVSPFDNTKDNGTPFVLGVIEGTSLGKYFINYKLFDVNNPNDSLSFTVRYNEFLSVEENGNVIESVGNIYPNPSTNTAGISLDLAHESAVKIQVYNSLGALVYNGVEQKLSGKNKVSFDCTNFNPGLYFVTVFAGESKVTRRLVISK